MTFENPVGVICSDIWDVLDMGIQGLKDPAALEPGQFGIIIRSVIEALMLYYVKCGS